MAPAVPGIAEVFHARFTEHAYPMHVHDAWTLLIVDDGAVRYELDRHERGAARHTVTLLPPHVPHDGRAATAHGFRKRVLYLDPTCSDAGPDRRRGGPPGVRRPVAAAAHGQLHARAAAARRRAGGGEPAGPDPGAAARQHLRPRSHRCRRRGRPAAGAAACATCSTRGSPTGSPWTRPARLLQRPPGHLVRAFTATLGHAAAPVPHRPPGGPGPPPAAGRPPAGRRWQRPPASTTRPT